VLQQFATYAAPFAANLYHCDNAGVHLTSAGIQFVYILTNGGPSDRTMIFPLLSIIWLWRRAALRDGGNCIAVLFPILVVFIIFLTRRMLREKGE